MAMAKSITAPALTDEEAPESSPSRSPVHSRFRAVEMDTRGCTPRTQISDCHAMGIQRGNDWKSMISLKPREESS